MRRSWRHLTLLPVQHGVGQTVGRRVLSPRYMLELDFVKRRQTLFGQVIQLQQLGLADAILPGKLPDEQLAR